MPFWLLGLSDKPRNPLIYNPDVFSFQLIREETSVYQLKRFLGKTYIFIKYFLGT